MFKYKLKKRQERKPVYILDSHTTLDKPKIPLYYYKKIHISIIYEEIFREIK